MGELLSPGARHLATRLGEGHGRRLLLLATTADAETVGLAIRLARKAWAVSVRTPAPVAEAVRAIEASGFVVDWQPGDTTGLAAQDGRFAVVACACDPGLDDVAVCVELGRVLQEDGVVMALLPEDATVPAMAGFTGVGMTALPGTALVSARRH